MRVFHDGECIRNAYTVNVHKVTNGSNSSRCYLYIVCSADGGACKRKLKASQTFHKRDGDGTLFIQATQRCSNNNSMWQYIYLSINRCVRNVVRIDIHSVAIHVDMHVKYLKNEYIAILLWLISMCVCNHYYHYLNSIKWWQSKWYEGEEEEEDGIFDIIMNGMNYYY